MSKVNENVQVPFDTHPPLQRFLYDTLRKHALKVNSVDRVDYQLSCSDLTTALSAGTNAAYFRVNKACIIKDVRASLLTASSSGAVTIDINKNGSTILSTKLTIDQGEKTSTTAATPYVLNTSSLDDDDEITIDIDGAGTNAAGLIVTVIVEI